MDNLKSVSSAHKKQLYSKLNFEYYDRRKWILKKYRHNMINGRYLHSYLYKFTCIVKV